MLGIAGAIVLLGHQGSREAQEQIEFCRRLYAEAGTRPDSAIVDRRRSLSMRGSPNSPTCAELRHAGELP